MTDETTDPTASRIDEQGRPEPPMAADETGTLLGFLEFQRATFAWKCADLTDEQLRASTAASPMTLGGMLKHLAFVEDYWFNHTIGRGEPIEPFNSADWDADEDFDWNSAAHDGGDELRALWRTAMDRSRTLVNGLIEYQPGAMEAVHGPEGRRYSLRWILTHMVEEYARHAGHADLLRESIDGLTGE